MKSKNNKTVIHLGLFGGLIFAIFCIAMFCLIATSFFAYLAILVIGTIIVWGYDKIHRWVFPRKPKNFRFNPNRY